MLTPAMLRGPFLGPYAVLRHAGILHRGAVGVTTGAGSSDLITEMIPWSTLTWTQVHHGQLPLWNPFSGFGMPLAFNWQSAPFSLPSLVGYLVPARYAFTVGVIVTLLVAGTGAYVLARVLGLSLIASVMAGTFFELSGPFLGWLGYPLGAVLSWTGWLLAAGILILRGEHRARDVSLFAVVLAFAIYAGNPESVAVLMLTAVVLLGLLLGVQVWRKGVVAVLPACGSLLVATLAGGALAAPLVLPGYQLGNLTTRVNLGEINNIPSNALTLILIPNYFRLLNNTPGIGFAAHVPSTIGFIAAPFALVAVACRWRNWEIRAVAILAIFLIALAFSSPVESLINHLPFLNKVYWSRALMPLALVLSVLAGVGADVILRRSRPRHALVWLLAGFLALGIWIGYAWLTGRGDVLPSMESARDRAFLWPVVDVCAGLAIVGVLLLVLGRRRRGAVGDAVGDAVVGAALPRSAAAKVSDRRAPGDLAPRPDGAVPETRTAVGTGLAVLDGAPVATHPEDGSSARRPPSWVWIGAVVLLFVIQTVTLAATGSSLWQSSSEFLPSSTDITTLQDTVGSATVGFGVGGCLYGFAVLGLPSETNVAYSVHQASVYDPIIPRSYFTAWRAATGVSGGVPRFAAFCPIVKSAAVARRFGITYVLANPRFPGPSGGVFVRSIGAGSERENLYRFPGVSDATLVPAGPRGSIPPPYAAGAPLDPTHPNPSTWQVTTSATDSAVLRLHLSDVPGWRATIDGRPLDLEPFSGVMLQARIPPGRHSIVVTYWPKAFSAGLVLALLGVVVLVVPLALVPLRRRRTRDDTT